MTVQYHASTVTNMDIEESKIGFKQFLGVRTSPRNSVSFVLRNNSYRVATVCLGLLCVLMLAGIIGQSIHYQKVEKENQDNVKIIDKEKEYLKDSLKSVQKEKEDIEAKRTQSQRDYNVLSQKRDQIEVNKNMLSEEINKLKLRQSQFETTNKALNKNIEQLRASKSQLDTNYNVLSAAKDLTTEINTLRENFNSLKKVTDNLRADCNMSARKKKELESNLNNVTAEGELLMVKISNLTAERDNLQGLVDKKTMQDRKCVNGWQKFENSCYYTSYGNRTWQKSREYCQSKGADLAIITSQNEMHFIDGLCGNNRVWIGLADEGVEGVWKWVDGTPLTLEFWGAGQPNSYKGTDQDCVEFWHRESGKAEWNDENCRIKQNFICEM
ncbi:C-type lectin domain family 10 member A-like [Platichthys flesus]|uniref:C-type lectin domain family 10 member A-like n=1 Tax=Platichthys flesus TaxID=8260 RepID=UPI002DB7E0EC|nr:C-type lectin domain family 10 member A-like [Platichthys flesus]